VGGTVDSALGGLLLVVVGFAAVVIDSSAPPPHIAIRSRHVRAGRIT